MTEETTDTQLQTAELDPLNWLLARESIGRLLKRAARMFDQELKTRLRDLGYHDVQPRHFAVFAHLDLEGTRATDLAIRAGMTRQSMGELVAELVAGGYLEQLPDPTDRRSKIVKLTPRGVQHVRAARQAIAEIDAVWRERLGPDRIGELRAMLEALAALSIENWER